MNRRSKELDKYMGKKVKITFIDGSVSIGVLEYGTPYIGSNKSNDLYCVIKKYSHIHFRKTHIKEIKEVNQE